MHRQTCPSCGFGPLDCTRFDSMMVLSLKMAFFTLRCPGCGASVSTVGAIDQMLAEEVQFAAIQVDAGMGHQKADD